MYRCVDMAIHSFHGRNGPNRVLFLLRNHRSHPGHQKSLVLVVVASLILCRRSPLLFGRHGVPRCSRSCGRLCILQDHSKSLGRFQHHGGCDENCVNSRSSMHLRHRIDRATIDCSRSSNRTPIGSYLYHSEGRGGCHDEVVANKSHGRRNKIDRMIRGFGRLQRLPLHSTGYHRSRIHFLPDIRCGYYGPRQNFARRPILTQSRRPHEDGDAWSTLASDNSCGSPQRSRSDGIFGNSHPGDDRGGLRRELRWRHLPFHSFHLRDSNTAKSTRSPDGIDPRP